MASRYPTIKVVDYCYHPLRVYDKDLDKDIIVPCGRCDGCLLHKANQWSMRCGMEIEGSPATIFGSLTYSNKYYPKLYPVVGNGSLPNTLTYLPHGLDSVLWVSDHKDNIRFNGVCDVPREDNIILRSSYDFPVEPIKISHWDNFNLPAVGYASKRDIQLWLKLLRRYLDEKISFKEKRVLERGFFRYFIISEYGPTTLRGHYHFLIFCQSVEIAEALLDGALYSYWQMCDKDRFDPYVHLCDSGARGYVTQYLTCFSSLPRVYQQAKEIKPFRLASKSPAIGYIEQDKAKIFEDVERGVIKYSRAVPRLESSSILLYPKDYCVTLFPKCYQYSRLSDSRRFFVYEYLYREVRKCGRSYFVLSAFLSKVLHASDYMAMRACYRFCKKYVDSPMYYYYLLDNYYYQVDMENLRNFYRSQESVDFSKEPFRIFQYYPNIEILCVNGSRSNFAACLLFALMPLGFDVYSLLGNKNYFEDVRCLFFKESSPYRKEVSDICQDMVKVSKFNEVSNNAPTIV